MAIKLKVNYRGSAHVDAAVFESTADAHKKITKAIHDALSQYGGSIYCEVDLELGR